MHDAQRIAYASPCYEAEETLNPAFMHVRYLDGRMVSVTLTTNIGEE